MNDSEARRKQLLSAAQSLHSEKKGIPAIHPRYRSLYSKLYHDSGSDNLPRGTFGARLCICILLFALFVAADYKKVKVFEVTSKRIMKEISYNIDLKGLWDKL